MGFTEICWSVSLCWLLWQGYTAWRVYIKNVALNPRLWLVQKIPPFSLLFDEEHRRTSLSTLLDTVCTIGVAQVIVEIVPGTSAAGVGAITGLAVSLAIRKAMADYAREKALMGARA